MEIKKQKPVWVVVFLRGGMDGLNFVIPNSGSDREIYESERPTLKIALQGKDAALKLDEHFSLHPAAKELHGLYQKEKLAFIHSAGLSLDTRSHFDAQTIMEQAAVSKANLLHSGWVTRYLNATQSKSKIAAVSFGQTAPTSILACNQAAIIDGVSNHRWPLPNEYQDQFEKSLRSLYALETDVRPWMAEWGLQTLEVLNEFNSMADPNSKANDYPKGELGGKLQALSKLLLSKPEIEVATVDLGGWDTHRYQGSGLDGTFANLVTQLSQSLTHFYNDISSVRPVIITVQTEFGRRLKENANRGTDHGHGSVMMVMGDGLKGGKVLGKWLGLKNESLYQRADLAVTSDYRDILSEILVKKFDFKQLSSVFPGFQHRPGLNLFPS